MYNLHRLILVFLIQVYAFSQNPGTIDSISTERNHRAFESMVHTEPTIAKKHLDTLLTLSKGKHYPQAEYFYHQDLGYHYFVVHKMEASISSFNKALKIAKELYLPLEAISSKIWLGNHEYFKQNNILAKSIYLEVLQESVSIDYTDGLAAAYFGLSSLEQDEEKILTLLTKIDSIYEKKGTKSAILANALSSIGRIYMKSKFKKRAKEYFMKSMEVAREVNYVAGLKYIPELLGEMALEDDNYEDAYKYFLTSLEDNIKMKDTLFLGHSLINLANVDMKTNNLDKAEERIHLAISYYEKFVDSISLTNSNLMLTQLYLKKGDISKAKYHLDYAITYPKTLSQDDYQINLLETTIAYLEITKNFKRAFLKQRKLDTLKANVLEKRNNEAFVELERKINADKKEQEIALLTFRNDLAQQQKINQRNLLLGGIGITSLLGLFFFFLFRNRQKTAKKLQELDKAKSNFFANISHEFRTPLTLISGPIQKQLKNEKLARKERDNLEMMNRNSTRLLSLVDQLLDISKIEAGSLQLLIMKGDLLPFIGTLADGFTYAAKQKEINYIINNNQSTKSTFFDKEIIEKIVVNLLSNGMKYTPAKGSIMCNSFVKEGCLHLEVKNTGPGLPKDALAKVFERFYQIDDHKEGVGIGLALVKELVTLHKGSIAVDSVPNEWTTFKVVLPTEKSNYNEEEFGKPAETSSNQPVIRKEIYDSIDEGNAIVKDHENPILLVVDDNTDVRTYVSNMFKGNYTILKAKNGQVGIDLAIEHVPDIIISDIMMPVKNGIALCNELKIDERTSHIPIILLTAKAGEENEIEGIKTGADDYVTKPFHEDLLQLRVEKLVESRKKLQVRYSQEVILRPKDIAITPIDEQFLNRVQKVLDEKLIESSFNIEDFSKAVGMSRMQLHRKLKALTGLSASEFIRSQRLKLAAQLLQKSEINVSQVGYSVGFNDHAYFSKCFKEMYHSTPSAYAKSEKKQS